jgi:hypothetical protein
VSRKARPRSFGKKLTPKQAAFVHHYFNPNSDGYGNATRACERAGYKGDPGSNQLAIQGWRNLRQPGIQVAMRAALSEQGFNQEFAANTLMGAMRATVVRAIPNGKGKLVPRRFPDYRVREEQLINHQLYGADTECLLASRLDRKGLSESDKQDREQIANFPPHVRMVIRDAIQAASTLHELEKSDVRKCFDKATPKPKAVNASGNVVTGQPSAPLDEDEWLLGLG